MKILCGISSIEFSCEHFPATLDSREYVHPIFALPQKRLLASISRWSEGNLTSVESYLLFLALLNSTELLEFRVPTVRTAETDSIVANNMESLIRVIGRLSVIHHPELALPRIVITQDTKNLDQAHYWIKSWESAIQEFRDAYRKVDIARRIASREAALERLIRTPTKKISSYSRILADWAAEAGNFPSFETSTPLGILTCSDYWKEIISRVARYETLFSIPKKDIVELIEHCEENVIQGSIHSHTLMKLLREAVEKQNNYLGLGDVDISGDTPYRILDPETSVEDANKLAIIDSAPQEKPIPENYPTKLAYLKAKLKYDMAQAYTANNTGNVKESSSGKYNL